MPHKDSTAMLSTAVCSLSRGPILLLEPRRLRGVRGVLRAGRSYLPIVWQHRTRAVASPNRGADPRPDGVQLKPARRTVVVVAVLWLGALVAPSAWAGEPADQLFARIDQVLKLLGDPDLKQPARAQER